MAISFLEADIEKMIFDNKTTIKDRGFAKIYEQAQRQFRLPSGKIIDILAWKETNDCYSFQIIELKRGEINLDTLAQAIEYFKEHLLTTAVKTGKHIEYDIILCGDTISESLDTLLFVGLKIRAFVYKFDFNGLFFSQVEGWNYEEGLPPILKKGTD